MGVKRVDQIGEFIAQDSAGKSYTILVFQDIVDAGTRGDPHAELRGVRSLKTAAGERVNYVEKGKYRVFSGWQEIEVTSSDPNAP